MNAPSPDAAGNITRACLEQTHQLHAQLLHDLSALGYDTLIRFGFRSVPFSGATVEKGCEANILEIVIKVLAEFWLVSVDAFPVSMIPPMVESATTIERMASLVSVADITCDAMAAVVGPTTVMSRDDGGCNLVIRRWFRTSTWSSLVSTVLSLLLLCGGGAGCGGTCVNNSSAIVAAATTGSCKASVSTEVGSCVKILSGFVWTDSYSDGCFLFLKTK
jgi:hypothetical protein